MGMDDILFNLRFTSKQFERSAKKSLKDEKKCKSKVKKAIEKGNLDSAKIFAAQAISKKNESLNYQRLAARLEAVSARVDTAIKMNRVSRSMKGVVKGMDKIMQGMNVDQISKVMDKFEKNFDDLDVRSQYMEDSMATSTSLTTPEDEVNNLIAQVADEHHLNFSSQIDVPVSKKVEHSVATDDLNARLERLKSTQ